MSNLDWGTIWRIARRDLSGRFRGLRLLLACLFLGVATLATIGSLTTAITGELSERGQTLLGGDVEIAMSQRMASADELAKLQRRGELSATVRMQAMANKLSSTKSDGPDAILTQLKGVDHSYPLYGSLTLQQGAPKALQADEIYIGQALVDRLDIRTGDTLRFGEADFRIAGVIADEPDRLSEGFTLGPVAIASLTGVERTGLIQPGSMYESKYRIKLPATADPELAVEAIKAEFPASGWEFKDRSEGAGSASRFIDRMGQFLTLVGLTALIIAGIGVGNGVASYLQTKSNGIATLKTLGASSGDIMRIYLVQIFVVASIAIGAGLVAGAILPVAIVALAGNVLPVQPGFAVHPWPLLQSALYGLLIALIFALPPLARARFVPANGLFRARMQGWQRPENRILVVIGVAFLAIVALALIGTRDPLFSGGFLTSALAILAMLAGIGWLVRKASAKVPRPRRPLLRMALGNLHRPGAQTEQLVVALGLGLTLFVTLAAIQTSLDNAITRTVPQEAPNMFVLDVPVTQEGRFRDIIRAQDAKAEVNAVPALRGTITGYRDVRTAELEDIPDNAWVLRGERGLTYSDVLPSGSELLEGEWWPKDYAGPPLVSVDAEMADALDLAIGDSLTVSILGVEKSARIASLRQINWDNMGFNYVMVFSPNTLRDAPHNLAATITMDEASERQLTRDLLAAFPSSSVIAVRDVIGQVQVILGQMATAIASAASIAILSGIAVLIGAIAASRQSRVFDSIIMKTLGATRRQILWVQMLEYGLLALLLAVVSLGLGSLVAWVVIVQIFEFDWLPDWPVVLATLGIGAVTTLGIGLLGSLPVLAARPAQALRAL